MDNTEPVATENPATESAIAATVKTATKAASPRTLTAAATARKPLKQKANVYQAEYLGSGTFKISKPKRRSAKRRQSALKNRRRGSRK